MKNKILFLIALSSAGLFSSAAQGGRGAKLVIKNGIVKGSGYTGSPTYYSPQTYGAYRYVDGKLVYVFQDSRGVHLTYEGKTYDCWVDSNGTFHIHRDSVRTTAESEGIRYQREYLHGTHSPDSDGRGYRLNVDKAYEDHLIRYGNPR